jgi:hypothetical protein
MNKDLTDIPKEDLIKEIERRNLLEKEQRKNKRIAKNKRFLEYKEIISKFLTHGRNTCKYNSNAYFNEGSGNAECNLCCFLELFHEYSLGDYEIDLSLTISEVKD